MTNWNSYCGVVGAEHDWNSLKVEREEKNWGQEVHKTSRFTFKRNGLVKGYVEAKDLCKVNGL